MKIINTIDQVRTLVKEWKKQGLTIGFVPTMGYLHEGHESLIKRAALENDKVIVSVFVNPIQFGPGEDFTSYPRDIDRDRELCKRTGAAIIFYPSKEEMYVDNFSTYVDLTGPSNGLCAKSRPFHFRGVCTVVSKLFLITTPDRAYFGQKDVQQLAVIKRMVRDLNFDIEVIGCPTVREVDGLAKSSRNTYLNQEERKAATILYKALHSGKEEIQAGEKNSHTIINTITNYIKQEPIANVDYVAIVSFPEMEAVTTINGALVIAVAVTIGKTRLIDNFILE